MAKKVWYEMNSGEVGKEEIMIIGNDEKVTPLRKYSRIVENIGESRKIGLYVKPDDREAAEMIIKEAQG